MSLGWPTSIMRIECRSLAASLVRSPRARKSANDTTCAIAESAQALQVHHHDQLEQRAARAHRQHLVELLLVLDQQSRVSANPAECIRPAPATTVG